MSYDDQIDQAIDARDIDTLVRYAYGSPCMCTKVRGEPLCVCEMQKRALRAKLVPLALFKGEIQRV